MSRLDLKKTLKELYQPSAKEPAFVDVPELAYFMIDGSGDPNDSPAFEAAVQALYALSFTLKFSQKKNGGEDYTVMPLEGLWWCEDMACFDANDKSNWLWTLMIVQPVPPNAEEFAALQVQTEKKKGLSEVGRVRMERFAEGRCAQIMHLGPYAEEGPTIAGLHAFIADNGYELSGKHHEIYLGDPRRTAPEKLKTVIRQPVRSK